MARASACEALGQLPRRSCSPRSDEHRHAVLLAAHGRRGLLAGPQDVVGGALGLVPAAFEQRAASSAARRLCVVSSGWSRRRASSAWRAMSASASSSRHSVSSAPARHISASASAPGAAPLGDLHELVGERQPVSHQLRPPGGELRGRQRGGQRAVVGDAGAPSAPRPRSGSCRAPPRAAEKYRTPPSRARTWARSAESASRQQRQRLLEQVRAGRVLGRRSTPTRRRSGRARRARAAPPRPARRAASAARSNVSRASLLAPSRQRASARSCRSRAPALARQARRARGRPARPPAGRPPPRRRAGSWPARRRARRRRRRGSASSGPAAREVAASSASQGSSRSPWRASIASPMRRCRRARRVADSSCSSVVRTSAWTNE